MRKRPHILLTGLAQHGLDRSIRIGLNRYARLHGPWHLHDLPAGRMDYLKKFLNQGVDGVVGHWMDSRFETLLSRTGLPLINFSAELENPQTPSLLIDNRAVGKMAADYFIERGFEHYLFIGIRGWRFERLREAGFCATLDSAGYTAVVAYEDSAASSSWVSILQSIPKPCAVLASMDQLARRVCAYAYEQELAVPEKIALLGVDNSDLICEASLPELSSIRLPGEQIGYDAGAALDDAMQNRPPAVFADTEETAGGVPIRLYSPEAVEERQSTDALAISDPFVANALHFIRESADRPITVTEVVLHSGTNRRNLERRFRNMLNSGILPHIHEAHLRHAAKLLRESSLSVPEIAERCGFRDQSSFSNLFRKRFHEPPGRYRRKPH